MPLRRARVIAIASSTGGLPALEEILSALPDNAPPVLITQHIEGRLVPALAKRLGKVRGGNSKVALRGEPLRPGMIRLAAPGSHMIVEANGPDIITSTQEAQARDPIVPAADPMMESVARVCRDRAIGIVLSGMGRDGAKGLTAMHRAGALCLGEAEESCVVYGMSRAAKEAGALTLELPRSDIAGHLRALL